MMSNPTKIVIGITFALVIAMRFGSTGMAHGQKEAAPAQVENAGEGEAKAVHELTQFETNLASLVGHSAAEIQEMELKCADLKREVRRVVDFKSELSFQLHSTSVGLAVREVEERDKRVHQQLDQARQIIEQVSGRLHELLPELAKKKIELFLFCKKNGLPDPTATPAADSSLESIEQSLAAIEAKLAANPK